MLSLLFITYQVHRIILQICSVVTDLSHSLLSDCCCCILVWFEPTSVAKSVKAITSSILPCLTYVSPNIHELHAMVSKITNATETEQTEQSTGNKTLQSAGVMFIIETIAAHIATLINAGIKNVVVKMGANGVLLGTVHVDNLIATSFTLPPLPNLFKSADGTIQYVHFNAPHVDNIVSVTGAGMVVWYFVLVCVSCCYQVIV